MSRTCLISKVYLQGNLEVQGASGSLDLDLQEHGRELKDLDLLDLLDRGPDLKDLDLLDRGSDLKDLYLPAGPGARPRSRRSRSAMTMVHDGPDGPDGPPFWSRSKVCYDDGPRWSRLVPMVRRVGSGPGPL